MVVWTNVLVAAVSCVLVGVCFLALPALSDRTLPLGVAVPADHAGDRVVREAVLRYRRRVVVVTLLGVLVSAPAAGLPEAAAAVLPCYLVTAGALAVFVRSRRRITAAKAAERWYEGVPTRLTASLTPASEPRVAVPAGWYAAALAVTAGAAALGVVLYPGLPARVPTHFDGAGLPDAFAARSVGSVFAPLLVAAGLTVALFATAHAVRRAPVRLRAGRTPEQAWARVRATDRMTQRTLAATTLLSVLLVDVLVVDGWLSPQRLSLAVPALVVFTLAFAAVAVLGTLGVSREVRGLDAPAPGAAATPRPQAPDDDRSWRGGLVYVNRDDPSLWVPKRTGVGWTVNVGHPVGAGLAVLLLVLVVASVVLGVVLGG